MVVYEDEDDEDDDDDDEEEEEEVEEAYTHANVTVLQLPDSNMEFIWR